MSIIDGKNIFFYGKHLLVMPSSSRLAHSLLRGKSPPSRAGAPAYRRCRTRCLPPSVVSMPGSTELSAPNPSRRFRAVFRTTTLFQSTELSVSALEGTGLRA